MHTERALRIPFAYFSISIPPWQFHGAHSHFRELLFTICRISRTQALGTIPTIGDLELQPFRLFRRPVIRPCTDGKQRYLCEAYETESWNNLMVVWIARPSSRAVTVDSHVSQTNVQNRNRSRDWEMSSELLHGSVAACL